MLLELSVAGISVSVVLYALMLLVVAYSVRREPGVGKRVARAKQSLIEKLGFAKTNVKQEVKTALLYVVAMFAVTFLIEIFFFSVGFAQDAQQVSKAVRSIDFGNVLIVISIASFVEELFFRSYLLPRTGILFSSFVFAYFHIIYGSLTELVGAFFLGILLAHEFQKTGNVFTPILSHYVYNLITIIAIFLL